MHYKSTLKYLCFMITLFCAALFLVVIQQRSNARGQQQESTAPRQVRDTNYYEEQRPVVVHAENYANGEFGNDEWSLGSSARPSYARERESTNAANYFNYDYFDPGKDQEQDQYQDEDARQISENSQVNQTQTAIAERPPKSAFEAFLSVINDMRTMWNIYQAFSGALASKPPSNETEPVLHPRVSDTEREKRQSTDVASGRYIQGDPLKGYYDFVITEGSYKFWAVFQVGTAILIIYSTFAAIYYSKVNPLVSDYDYTDYLGGARGFPDNVDFVDPVADERPSQPVAAEKSWYSSLLPRIGKSLQTVFETLDKALKIVVKMAAFKCNENQITTEMEN